ncbi:MAG: YjbH domain-containing protein [Candidatus Zixiibacteriota bacterium]|nr:MAG: YjbH domain-containing protein [candidate division Zixibacteria bacterium]
MLRAFKIFLLIAGITCVSMSNIAAQKVGYSVDEATPSLYDIPPRDLIDAPTAGTLPRGCFDIEMRVYNNGGILGRTSIGLSDRFMLGMSYGAEGIIAERSTNRNPRIEFNVKLRLLDETYYLPALAIGFNSQGYGAYIDDMERYTYKSKGFYIALSRSYDFHNISTGGHAGVNYSLENEKDDEEEPTFFFGFDARFSYNLGVLLEYDMALNDDRSSVGYAKGRGYLNFGLKWFYSENLELEVILKNLLLNRQEGASTFGRELRFTYIEYF